jgi:hypothetical protein
MGHTKQKQISNTNYQMLTATIIYIKIHFFGVPYLATFIFNISVM